jgi:hypothetical protein
MIRPLRRVALSALLALAGAVPVAAVELSEYVTPTFSERLRGEFTDWFRPPRGTAAAGAQRYSFLASQLRAGVRVTLPRVQLVVEMQDTRLVGLPDDASLAPPLGNLSPGATYFAHTHDTDQGEPFLKLAHLTLRQSGFSATVGRFEYSDGLETIPGDPSLAFLKRQRIGERLVGPFNFTHVTRSFDGVRGVWDSPAWNATALAVRPAHGGFEVSANREMGDVGLAGLALTRKGLPWLETSDVRLFWLYYEDARDNPVKVDNRPLGARSADHDEIAIHTVGAHAVAVADAGPGRVDGLLWGAIQKGEWGREGHDAWAWAVEAGYQLPRLPWGPWLRGGWNRSSGDAHPTDGHHETFFQILPTARTYALLPFYNLMNSDDVFAQLLLQPDRRVQARVDYHRLRVTEGGDLWYSGGGATNDDVFGFAGSPAAGRHDLGHLVDLSLTVALPWSVTLGGYYGHAFGGGVVGATFAGRDADYGFVEGTYRY